MSVETRSGGRRAEILAVASGMFARNGFHGTSMDDLGAAVGLSGPALYRYFPGKEAILSAMLVDISERLLAGGMARTETSNDPGTTLEALVEFHVEFALDEPDLIAVQFRDLDAVPLEERRLVRRLQGRYVDLWVDALVARRPQIGADRARAAAHAVFGLINSTPHSARLTRPEMADLLGRTALAALAAIPTPE
jgi:AcrR family transcriptional regulator